MISQRNKLFPEIPNEVSKNQETIWEASKTAMAAYSYVKSCSHCIMISLFNQAISLFLIQ